MSKLRAISFLFVVFVVITSVAVAEQVEPRADLYFDSATAFLATDKRVVFDCTTYDVHDQISITNVWLEQKVDGDWTTIKSLPSPTNIAQNTLSYGAVADYSEAIGVGTFRIGFTANADGHTITRYSNSRTF